jgi:hypothetical protein
MKVVGRSDVEILTGSANAWKKSASGAIIVAPIRHCGAKVKEMMDQEPDAKELAFLQELEKHVNKWVAIIGYGSDEESIVAAGESVREARQNAESQGFKDTTFFKVPPTDRLFVPLVPL